MGIILIIMLFLWCSSTENLCVGMGCALGMEWGEDKGVRVQMETMHSYSIYIYVLSIYIMHVLSAGFEIGIRHRDSPKET